MQERAQYTDPMRKGRSPRENQNRRGERKKEKNTEFFNPKKSKGRKLEKDDHEKDKKRINK